MTLADRLRFASRYGIEFLSDFWHVQTVMGFIEQPQSTRLVESAFVRFPDHARRSSDGDGDCVSCCAQQDHDVLTS